MLVGFHPLVIWKKPLIELQTILFVGDMIYLPMKFTTKKSKNTNGNTKGIFLLVNCQQILPTEIFPWYLQMELQ